MEIDELIQSQKTHKQLGFSHLETAEIVVKLNTLLANYQVHYHKLQNFHWNIQGADFFELHEKFEELYTSAFSNIDAIAERIRVFGKTPLSTMKEYLDQAELLEEDTNLKGEFMVNAILNDYKVLMTMIIDVHESATRNGDLGTAHMMKSLINEIETNHWMLSAWLKK